MSYDQTLARVETYFDRTATRAWEALTSDAPVSKIRQTVREGRDAMRAQMLARLPDDLRGARILDAGCGAGQMTAELAARGADVVQPFLTMQYLYAVARTDRPEADRLMAAIETRAADTAAFDHAVWRDVALPACRGLLAHARGDFATCVRDLGAALPRLVETGGSHAQRDLFEQIHLDALMQSGRISTAQQVLEMRRMYDPDGVPVNRMLAQVYTQAGLPEQAEQAAARAAATLGAR